MLTLNADQSVSLLLKFPEIFFSNFFFFFFFYILSALSTGSEKNREKNDPARLFPIWDKVHCQIH